VRGEDLFQVPALGEAECATAWAEGGALTLEQAAALALHGGP
jgi:hypothetical protein